ncbi:MAG: heme biosynthesis protein HemY [Alcanivoracaceae bacterium]|jgi:HemY protein|nr:heme biosynthesis protein HemY [Alcanivoracaceae bacterium]
MKRTLILLILLAIAALLFGRWLLDDPGYVLLIRDGLRVETSLGFLLLLLIVAALVWSLLTLVLVSLWRLAGLGRRSRWQELLARRRLRAGFFAMVAGDWARAGRLFAAAGNSSWAVPAGCAEALAAAQRGDHEQVTVILKRVAGERRGQPAADLLAARLLLEEGAIRQARARLERLVGGAERNPHRLRLLAEVLERDQDWPALVEILPALKNVMVDHKAYAGREQRAWMGLLNAVAAAPGESARRLEGLRRTWKEMPDSLQKKAVVRALYASLLVASGDGAAAFALVRKDIERNWDDRLVTVLETVDDVSPEKILQQLEQWLEVRPGNGALLMCAGRMAMKAKLWGKARSFFETAARAGNVTALAELARLHSALGDTDRALAALERRVMLLNETLPALPLPAARNSHEG